MRMTAARPYETITTMNSAAERTWWDLQPADWLEAFRAHPRIGERASNSAWAAQEQAQVSTAHDATVAGLALGNEQYLAKFGYIYIVCATGKSGEEMLGILNARLPNNAEDELRIAATEQSKITRLRLAKLVTT